LFSINQIIGDVAGGINRGGAQTQGKKEVQGKETAGFVPLRPRLKISNIFG
jgi:hypothetical protein